MYKLLNKNTEFQSLIIENADDSVTSIPFDPANTDYRNFKKEINAESAELQDAEGNTMTAAEAKAYVATLP